MRSNFLYFVAASLLAALFFIPASCLDDPVGIDYFNNLDLIKGKNRPQAPCIRLNMDVDPGDDETRPYTCGMTAVFEVGCINNYNFDFDFSSGETPDCVYPDEGGATIDDCNVDTDSQSLNYLLMVTTTDPVTVTDFEYYSGAYFLKEILLGSPFNPNNDVVALTEKTFYFWAIATDGGRFSNHSNVIEIAFPGGLPACPP